MTQPTNVVAVAEGLTTDAFHQILEMAISGKGKLPGAKTSANNLLRKHRNPETAVKWIVNEHIAMAGGQGFATNWGGFFVSIVTIPANLAASTFVQARMVAAIAHLRGFEVSDPRVRSAILMVMLGPGTSDGMVANGTLPSPVAIATAPVFDARLDAQITKALFDRAMNSLGGKRLGVWVGKRIPFVGGGVGAVVDGLSTHSIAKLALDEFPNRRPRLGGGWAEQDPGTDEA